MQIVVFFSQLFCSSFCCFLKHLRIVFVINCCWCCCIQYLLSKTCFRMFSPVSYHCCVSVIISQMLFLFFIRKYVHLEVHENLHSVMAADYTINKCRLFYIMMNKFCLGRKRFFWIKNNLALGDGTWLAFSLGILILDTHIWEREKATLPICFENM